MTYRVIVLLDTISSKRFSAVSAFVGGRYVSFLFIFILLLFLVFHTLYQASSTLLSVAYQHTAHPLSVQYCLSQSQIRRDKASLPRRVMKSKSIPCVQK
ncbi:hypothetical protein FJZ53_07240 [Candidatus Woesearchaeota archaeon]|nr:hypothetical protein [Candidatus Woesearchaeota archaeon]